MTVETSLQDFCKDQIPWPILPSRPQWLKIYNKTWELASNAIVSSDVIRSRRIYCDYPDADVTYLWDTCFCSLFHRYAALQGAHPCMNTIDAFYALMHADGYIPRVFNWKTFTSRYGSAPEPRGVNPPLLAWAEWNYYQLSGDRERLAVVLPKLTLHFEFIEQFLMAEPGFYRWHFGGSGWDNINNNQNENEIAWWVDLLAQQGLAAQCIAQIADAIGDSATADSYRTRWREKKAQLAPYWNADQNWYCHHTRDHRFTRKTITGTWPMLAGLVEPTTAQRMVGTLMDPACFNTSPMPLPTLSKDEPGYNPHGEYWLGSVWLNMSIMVIRALEQYGFATEAMDLNTRTLDGIASVYDGYEEFPHSLWECYAPEAPGPASHGSRSPDKIGGVRKEFAGWTGVLVNLIIENAMGFQVDAPNNRLSWNIRLTEEHGIERLRFGNVCTTLRAAPRLKQDDPVLLTVESNQPYTLLARVGQKQIELRVSPGRDQFRF